MKKTGFWVCLLILTLGIMQTVQAQTFIYVKHDATGNNNGTNWTDAYTSLQFALAAANAGDDIWVSAGTYTPTLEVGGIGNRFKTYQLKNGVGLYGGFAGTEDPLTFNLADRDFDAHETILSGDLGGGVNVYHVFRHVNHGLNGTAILDGFTISSGRADGSTPDNIGGGMLNSGTSAANGSSPTIVNCIFKNNQAVEGGAIYNSRYSSPLVSYTTFSNNTASTKGGAVFNIRNTPTFNYCTFTGNTTSGSAANDGGGAMYNAASNLAEGVVISNSIFTNNIVPTTGTNTYGGGAIFSSLDPGKLQISSSIFIANTGKYGGAIYHRSGSDVNRDNSEVSISYSVFEQNTAEYGGAIFSDRHNTVVTSCIIRGNEAVEQSGGYYGRLGSSLLINSLITGNKSGKHGGGVYFNVETPEMINSTVSGNFSGERGGGISMIGGSVVGIKNTIVWGNASPEGNELWVCNNCITNLDFSVYDNSTGDVFITSGGVVNATNSLTSDPAFVYHIAPSATNTPNTSGNYMIKSTSPAIDVALNAHVPAAVIEDLRGRVRIIDGDNNATATVDMGAYEYDPDYCNSTAPSTGNGSSATPYQISTLGHLCWISQNPGEWSKFFIQTADIDASDTEFWNDGAGFSPIGNSTTLFNGGYNGNDFLIDGLYIHRGTTDHVGLFGYNRGVLSNIHLTNATVTGRDHVGAIVGYHRYSSASVSNCSSRGIVTGNFLVGGLVGYHESSAIITDCFSACNVEAVYRVGGLVGRSSGGHIYNSFATGDVSGTGNGASPNLSNAGGFIGGLVNAAEVKNCYATGSVAGFSNTGGFVGSMNGSLISNCYSSGEVFTQGQSAAGFIGLQTTGVVENCYSLSNLTRTGGTSTWNGGFVGRNWQGKVIHCYSKGKVEYANGTNPTNRGFAGPVDVGGGFEMTGNFWDVVSSGQATSEGIAVGEITANMKAKITFTAAGWDFQCEVTNGTNDVWGIGEGINDGYPWLSWQSNPLICPCTNPTDGGTIAISLPAIICYGDAVSVTSTALPTGHNGDLEYQWQFSIVDGSSGFSDIGGATSTVYDAPSVTQTTWFRRLARVTCMADWSGAIASNVLEVTVNPLPNFTYTKTDITCFNAGDGTITITASGGSDGGYEYRIHNGTVWIGWQIGNTFTSLPAGSYSLEIRDNNGCVQVNGEQ